MANHAVWRIMDVIGIVVGLVSLIPTFVRVGLPHLERLRMFAWGLFLLGTCAGHLLEYRPHNTVEMLLCEAVLVAAIVSMVRHGLLLRQARRRSNKSLQPTPTAKVSG